MEALDFANKYYIDANVCVRVYVRVCMCVSCVSSHLVSSHLVSSRCFRDGICSENWTRTAVNAIKSGRSAHVRPLPQNTEDGELVAISRQVKHN